MEVLFEGGNKAQPAGIKWIKVILFPWDEQTTVIPWEMLFFRGDTEHKRGFPPTFIDRKSVV